MFGFIKAAFKGIKWGISKLKKKKKKDNKTGGDAPYNVNSDTSGYDNMYKGLPEFVHRSKKNSDGKGWWSILSPNVNIDVKGRTDPNDLMSPYKIGLEDKPPKKTIFWILGGSALLALIIYFITKKKQAAPTK